MNFREGNDRSSKSSKYDMVNESKSVPCMAFSLKSKNHGMIEYKYYGKQKKWGLILTNVSHRNVINYKT